MTAAAGHLQPTNRSGKKRQRENLVLFALILPSLLLVGCVVLGPSAWLFSLSFLDANGAFSTENYRRLLDSPTYFRTFQTTFQISFVVTVICALIGYPTAYLINLLSPKWARLCLLAVIIPLWTSILVRTYAWLIILQRKGLLNDMLLGLGLIEEPLRLVHNSVGTAIGMVHIMTPFLILPLYVAMQTIDKRLVQAAANLGASPVKAFWLVFFPLSLPGLLAGLALVFVLCLGFFVTPVILGGGQVIMIAERIQHSVEFFSNWGAASALAVVLLIITVIALTLAALATRLLNS